MNTKRTPDVKDHYSIAIAALGIAALSNVALRDWLGLASGLCLLIAFAMLRTGAPNRQLRRNFVLRRNYRRLRVCHAPLRSE